MLSNNWLTTIVQPQSATHRSSISETWSQWY